MLLVNGYDVSNNAGRQTSVPGAHYRWTPKPPASLESSRIKPDGGADVSGPPILGMLDRIGFGYVVLDKSGAIIKWNAAAQTTLACQGTAANMPKQLGAAFKNLVRRSSAQFPVGTLAWVAIPFKDGEPIIIRDRMYTADGETSIVVLLDRETKPGLNPETLKQMFGLTGAETELALRLVQGDAPLDIARSRRLSRTTIRSQLASLFQKTETKRQSELVALLGRISVLP